MEYTSVPNLRITMFNPPNGNIFRYVSKEYTSAERSIYTIDIPSDENNAVTNISLNFYDMQAQKPVFVSFNAAKF